MAKSGQATRRRDRSGRSMYRSRRRCGRATAVAAALLAPLLAASLAATALAGPASAAVAKTATFGWHSRALTAPPGAAKDPEAQLAGISCRNATDCLAGGSYQDKTGVPLPMVATESDGHWARAISLELPANAASAPDAGVADVACWAVRSCIAMGNYAAGPTSASVGFVATESDGSWGQATELPVPEDAPADPGADFSGAACPARGSCVIVGSYQDSAGNPVPVVITESHGTWLQPRQISLPASAQGALGAQLISVACQTAGSCAAVGSYIPRTGADHGLEVIESDGTWQRGTEVRAPSGVKPRLGDFLTGVSCWADMCMAVGGYSAATGVLHPLAVSYSSGSWGRAVTVPAARKGAGVHSMAQLVSIACTRAGCMAVGSYFGGGPGLVPIAASESGGRWNRTAPVPLPAGHGTGTESQALLHAVACNGRACTAAGFFLHTGPSVLAMVSAYR